MTSVFTISTTAADLWGSSADGIENADTKFYIGFAPSGSKAKVWIPFVVNLPKGIVISAATLLIVGETTRTDDCPQKIGCDAADNASAPASWTDLNAKTLTTAFNSTNIANNVVAGTEYQVDVTTAVQEILNRAGWSFGNTLAVLIHDNGTSSGDLHRFAMFEHATYAEPKLQISVPSNIPRGGMV